MHILNLTFTIEEGKVADWFKFLNEVFIPFSDNGSYFIELSVLKVHVTMPDGEQTYSVQLFAKELELMKSYQQVIFPSLMREMNGLFGSSVLCFATHLEKLGTSE